MLKQESEIKKSTPSESSLFVQFAQDGNLTSLVEHVYYKEDPYINKVESRSRLARNALIFFIIGNHNKAIEQFFDSPFAQDISTADILKSIESIIYKDKEDLLEIIQKKSKTEITNKESFDLLLLACKQQSVKIIKVLLSQKEELSQQEKLKCFISLLESEQVPNKLKIFQFLETKFNKFLYHQNDDQLVLVAVKKNNKEIVNYLMFDKKLRITKHLNMLSYANSDFARIVAMRKKYDSVEQKMKNLEKKLPEKINCEKGRKIKI